MKRNEGFTLIELVVTLVAAALVTFAAASLLLMGTRIQHASNDDMSEQQTVRIVLTLLEDMAGSGDIGKISHTSGGWKLHERETFKVLFEYVAEDQTVYQGEAANAAPLLTGLNNAGVTMDDKLMTLSFDTDRGDRYKTQVYCRIGIEQDGLDQNVGVLENDAKQDMETAGIPHADKRLKLLNNLLKEYAGGKNTGRIQESIAGDPYAFYSAWYIGGYQGKDGWNRDTPWCACFVSWAAVKSEFLSKGESLVFANVDSGMQAFQNAGGWQSADDMESAGKKPNPGDYIFFDWTGDRSNPSHVGVVLDVSETKILTIEGNSSGRVAIRQYDRNAEDIMGYGTLPAFQETAT